MNHLGFIYVIYNELFEKYHVKIGSTSNYVNRYFDYITYYPYPCKFIKVYEIINSKWNCYEIDEIIKVKLYEFRYNIKGGGTEHYKHENITMLLEGLFKLGQIIVKEIENIDESKFIRKTEIDSEKIKKNEHYQKMKVNIKKIIDEFDNVVANNSSSDEEEEKEYIFNERFYQEEIIRKSIIILYNDGRVLIKSPTGSGKTYIVIRIIKEIKINNFIIKKFIIFTPRKKLNEQNIGEKYLNILGNNYKIIHKNKFSDKNKFLEEYNSNEFVIVVACYNSAPSLMKFMENIDIELVWFDEAHKIESWNNLTNIYQNYWMTDNKIRFRIFSTATPYNSMITN